MITVKRSQFRMEVVPDQDADASYLEQEGFEDRLAQFRNGDLWFVGVRAVCELSIPLDGAEISLPVKTPGLWGIETCGLTIDDAYFREVFDEECKTLEGMLAQLNVKVES